MLRVFTNWGRIAIIPARTDDPGSITMDLLEFVAPGGCIIAALIIPVLDYYNKIAAPDLIEG